MLILTHSTLSSLLAIYVFLRDADASPFEIREAVEGFASGGCVEGSLLPLVVWIIVYLLRKAGAM